MNEESQITWFRVMAFPSTPRLWRSAMLPKRGIQSCNQHFSNHHPWHVISHKNAHLEAV